MSSKVRLSDTVIAELENMISKMQPGERLPTEAMLAEKFSVGRSTIRESLKVLSYKKLIVRKNEGTFVAENVGDCLVDPLKIILNMDEGNLAELIELREWLELIVVRLAVRRASPEDITDLERCNWLMSEPGMSRSQRRERDFAFHNRLAQSAGNAIIAELLHAVRKVVAGHLEENPLPEEVSREGQTLHSRIINAIKAQDESEAVALMEEYLMIVDYQA